MLILRLWLLRLASVQALLLVLTGLGAMPALAEKTNPTTEEVGKMLDAATLIAREIEARVVTLQQDAAEGRQTSGPQLLTQALISFYAQREYRPMWDQPGRLEQLIGALESLADDGLNPDDYQVAQLRQALPLRSDNSIEQLPLRLADELRATNSYLRALYHLFNGKVDPASLDPQWNFDLQDVAPIADSARVAGSVESGHIPELFEQTRPQHPIYRSFKAGLVRYRELAAKGGWPSLPVGETFKPCAIDPQIAILRRRLQATGEYAPPPLLMGDLVTTTPVQKCLPPAKAVSSAAGDSVSNEPISGAPPSGAPPVDPEQVFDEYLVEAVKKFQRDQYLDADGALGPATRAALNVSVQSRIDQIRVNLDRARWLLHNIPPEMLLVDVAGFKVTYFKGNLPIWRSRVQVGMAYRTTPIFKSEINYITLNPTWTVPPTILRKDVLPKIRKDIGYLQKSNIRVLDSNGKELNPANINWNNPGNITLRQDAGDDAALGKAVIRFPNSYAVYLHDTPHQKLFDKSQRAFSSGCIRVERALELVELLLAETPKWDAEAINSALATGKTRNVTLAKRIPILIAYWTVDTISETQIAFKPDIYARDAKVLAALNKRS